MNMQGSGDYRPTVDDTGFPLNMTSPLFQNDIYSHLPEQLKTEALKNYSTEDLIKEIKKRQLSEQLDATVTIEPNGSVSVIIKKLHWPAGVHNVKIEYVEDEHTGEKD